MSRDVYGKGKVMWFVTSLLVCAKLFSPVLAQSSSEGNSLNAGHQSQGTSLRTSDKAENLRTYRLADQLSEKLDENMVESTKEYNSQQHNGKSNREPYLHRPAPGLKSAILGSGLRALLAKNKGVVEQGEKVYVPHSIRYLERDEDRDVARLDDRGAAGLDDLAAATRLVDRAAVARQADRAVAKLVDRLIESSFLQRAVRNSWKGDENYKRQPPPPPGFHAIRGK